MNALPRLDTWSQTWFWVRDRGHACRVPANQKNKHWLGQIVGLSLLKLNASWPRPLAHSHTQEPKMKTSDMTCAYLRDANLSRADLSRADLRNADLTRAY